MEGLASSPHHLSNEDSLPTPGVSTIIVDKVLDNLTLGRYLSLPISASALVLLTQEPWVLKKKRMQNISVCLYFSLPTVTLFVELLGTSGFLGAI